MAKGFKDSQGVEWFPIWHGENLSDWLRYTGISLDQFTTMTIPAFSIVEAMWYTVRGQAREQLRRNIERGEFLRRFDPPHVLGAIEVLIQSFNDSMPTEGDIPPSLLKAGDDPLQETPSGPSPGTPG